MQTEGWKRIYTQKELKQVIQDWMAKNPDAWADGIIAYLLAQDNIYVAEGNSLSDIKPIQKVYEENPNIILSYWNLTTDNEWNLQEIAEDKSLSKDDLTKEERLNLSTSVDKNEYSDIWDKVVKWYDEFKPVKENAELIADTYRELIDKKNELTSMYDSWDSASKEIYKKKLDAINEALANAENSEEFKNVVEEIRRSPLAWYRSAFNPVISSTLFDMAGHRWSETLNSNDSFSNWVFWDVANSPFARWMNVTNLTFSLNKLPEIYDKYNFDESKNLKSSDEHSSGWEEEKTSGWETKTETTNKNNISISGSPLKPTKITDEKVTDEMSFWDDVAWQWWEEYLNKRNIALATHLKQKWIETPEEIEEYLSKYPSWKNAKQEWRDNTINNLTEKMATMKWPEIKKDETKDETKKEKWENREANEDKDRLNKRLEEAKWTKDKASTRDVKDKKRLWDDWQPDNDSSINWTEELKTEKDWNDFWNEDQKNETKKQTVKRPEKLDVKSAKKETKTDTKKITKKDVEKVINAAKSSPTIMNLLKKVKK